MKKESTWGECIEGSLSIKVSIDKAKAESLIDTAEGRSAYLKESEIKKSNASYVFERHQSL